MMVTMTLLEASLTPLWWKTKITSRAKIGNPRRYSCHKFWTRATKWSYHKAWISNAPWKALSCVQSLVRNTAETTVSLPKRLISHLSSLSEQTSASVSFRCHSWITKPASARTASHLLQVLPQSIQPYQGTFQSLDCSVPQRARASKYLTLIQALLIALSFKWCPNRLPHQLLNPLWLRPRPAVSKSTTVPRTSRTLWQAQIHNMTTPPSTQATSLRKRAKQNESRSQRKKPHPSKSRKMKSLYLSITKL